MGQVTTEHFSKGIQWSLEFMGMTYVAMGVLFLVSPDWIILVTNQLFGGRDWPVVFFPTERFWFALAVTVPGTRAFLAFTASRRPAEARLCIRVLGVSLVLAAIFFAVEFVFRKHAPLYALGFILEAAQVAFYYYLYRKLP